MSKPSDEYLTPPDIARAVEQFFYGPADFDPYAHALQYVKVAQGRTIAEKDGAYPDGIRTLWCNPPFSEASSILPELARYVFKNDICALMLVPASPGSEYWAKSVWGAPHCKALAWLKRQKFHGIEDGEVSIPSNTIRQDTALLLYLPGNDPIAETAQLQHFKSCFGPHSRCVVKPEAM